MTIQNDSSLPGDQTSGQDRSHLDIQDVLDVGIAARYIEDVTLYSAGIFLAEKSIAFSHLMSRLTWVPMIGSSAISTTFGHGLFAIIELKPNASALLYPSKLGAMKADMNVPGYAVFEKHANAVDNKLFYFTTFLSMMAFIMKAYFPPKSGVGSPC